MGKRELLLAVIFVTMGFVVYQVTAPADTSTRRWSFAGILDEIRREVRGNQGRAEVTKTETLAAPETLREIRFQNQPGELVVVGEEREDIEVELKVISRAYDNAEAKRTADATALKTDLAGESLRLMIDYPEEGNQTSKVSLKVPRRLALRIDEKSGRLQASHLAAVTTAGIGRGATTLTDIAGAVHATQRGSTFTLTGAASLKLNGFSVSEAKISGIRGNVVLEVQGGDIRLEGIDGAIEVEARNAEMRFDSLAKTRGPIRINARGGELELQGVSSETRIDGRHTEVRVTQGAAAPLAIYSDFEGRDAIELTLADAGMKIDALASNGLITVDETLSAAGLSVHGAADSPTSDHRLEGSLRGGGPAVTLRATRGRIVIRSK